jgi:UDP:flavonoid glycosyltransferase YjiC (YdhE family)
LPSLAKINNPAYESLRVLLAPLDWGLGHATRCVPIIKELLNQRCEVIVAATGAQRALLQEEFASLTFVELPGYRINYGKNRAFTILRLICSIPKILIRIKQERAWLGRFAAQEGIDLVLSDNRYGLAVPGVFCVFVTHQLLIKTPFGRLADLLLQRMNYRVLRHFSRCWVPDIAGDGALAGELSNPVRLPAIPTRYIGWLSRFSGGSSGGKAENALQAGMTAGDADPELLLLLSGPEPQRTLLEKLILRQAAARPCRMVLVRGLPAGGVPLEDIPPGMLVYEHLSAAALERVVDVAGVVIARSGYSTVMDLRRMGKRALLIPTPGQTEQEYLGRYLAGKGWVACVRQDDFSLEEALALAKTDIGWPADGDATDSLRMEIGSVLAQSRPSVDRSLADQRPSALG